MFVALISLSLLSPADRSSQDPTRYGQRTIEIMNSVWPKPPDPPSPEEKLASLFSETFATLAQPEIRREGRANSVSIYVAKRVFQDMPFPDRPAALDKLAAQWCRDVRTYPWLTRVRVRDVRTGEELAACSCP